MFVQHPREAKTAIGTARLAHLCLPSSELVIGVAVDDDPTLGALLARADAPPLLLYPGENAAPLESFEGTTRTLVVIDGTWPQSKKLLRLNPKLASLPRAAFTPLAPSNYRIRREPKRDYVSTIESVAHALGVLEGDRPKFEGLLAPFRAMIDAQIAHEETCPSPRAKRPKNKPRRERFFPELIRAGQEGRLVCVVVEANAWPYKTRKTGEHHPDELVQILAVRVGTDETIDVVVRPRNPLAPSTLSHTALSREELAAGVTREEARASLAAFFRDTDVVVPWGHYTTNLAKEEGLVDPTRIVCLRTAAQRFVNGRVGTVEDLLESHALVVGPSLGRGRGGRRLAGVVAALGWLTEVDGGNHSRHAWTFEKDRGRNRVPAT